MTASAQMPEVLSRLSTSNRLYEVSLIKISTVANVDDCMYEVRVFYNGNDADTRDMYDSNVFLCRRTVHLTTAMYWQQMMVNALNYGVDKFVDQNELMAYVENLIYVL